eukprot:9894350-Ditylum_brightwellii.AAC.1
MGMGMVLARAEMLNIDIVSQPGENIGTNHNDAILAFNQVITHLNKIVEQRENFLKLLNMDTSKAWGDGILMWCNIVRTKPPVQLGVNGRYLPFIINEKEDV